MSSLWTVQQVLAFAPDGASASAGQGLAKPGKWLTLGRSARAMWGELQGSGKDPYRTRIDLAGPAYKCSCPSRKFPCKHGLGLMLISAQSFSSLVETAEPEWVAQWMDQRAGAVEKKEQKAQERAQKPVDVEAQAKRIAAREAKVSDGMMRLELHMGDLFKQGMASAHAQDPAAWSELASRMVDAQATGLARDVARVAQTVGIGADWQHKTAREVGRLWLLLKAYQNQASLPEGLRREVRTLVGWTTEQAEVEAGEKVKDVWRVVGRVVEEDDRLTVERVWLWGTATGTFCYLLAFKVPGAPAKWTGLSPGMRVEAQVGLYPGVGVRRGLLPGDVRCEMSDVRCSEGNGAGGYDGVEGMMAGYAKALGENPFLWRWPAVVGGVRLGMNVVDGETKWRLVDGQGKTVDVIDMGGLGWDLLSFSGGREMTVFGELEAEGFRVLSAWGDAGFVSVWRDDAVKALVRGGGA
jgi:hypothetical protein